MTWLGLLCLLLAVLGKRRHTETRVCVVDRDGRPLHGSCRGERVRGSKVKHVLGSLEEQTHDRERKIEEGKAWVDAMKRTLMHHARKVVHVEKRIHAMEAAVEHAHTLERQHKKKEEGVHALMKHYQGLKKQTSVLRERMSQLKKHKHKMKQLIDAASEPEEMTEFPDISLGDVEGSSGIGETNKNWLAHEFGDIDTGFE